MQRYAFLTILQIFSQDFCDFFATNTPSHDLERHIGTHNEHIFRTLAIICQQAEKISQKKMMTDLLKANSKP